MLALVCVSQVPHVRGSTVSPGGANVTGQVTIDKAQFMASVPPYAILGDNYSLRVVIDSNASLVVPVIIQISVPVGGIYVHPRVVRGSIQPNSLMLANFTILPFGHPGEGPFNVTVLLYVFFPLTMSSPLLVDQATAPVLSIGPNPFPYLPVVLVSAVAVGVVLVVVFYREIFRKDVTRFPMSSSA
jgi:hypothetical protein